MDVKKVLNILAAKEGVNSSELVRRLSAYTGEEISITSFLNRMNTGTIRYNEVDKIAEMLGYEIEFKKKSKPVKKPLKK